MKSSAHTETQAEIVDNFFPKLQGIVSARNNYKKYCGDSFLDTIDAQLVKTCRDFIKNIDNPRTYVDW